MRTLDDNQTVIYEVNLEAEAAIEGPFDTWLRDHVADMLQLDGFLDAEILEDPDPPPARIRRTVQYRLQNQAALDRYLSEQAPRVRQRGIALFGDRFTAERRVLAHREEFARGKVSTENCLNCGEVLRGQHCSHCGQPAKVRVLSLWALLQDVIGDLLNADSRVWRTLWPLGFRPGLLTQEYLRGRRARYTPPFRMYLVLSVVFFVLASFEDPGDAFVLDVGANEANLQFDTGPAPGQTRGDAVVYDTKPGPGGPRFKARPLDDDAHRLLDGIVARVPATEREALRTELEREMSHASPEERGAAGRFIADPCSEGNLRVDIDGDFQRYEQRLRSACRKIMADQQGFGRALFENIPKMMFIFLPLIAAVLAFLYLRSRRYYVEHLLFVVHFHAFFFLAGIVVLLMDHLSGLLPARAAESVQSVMGLVGVALVFYVPWYLLKALRRVYAQSWWKTVPKFGMLGIAYFISLLLTGLGLLAYTALTL